MYKLVLITFLFSSLFAQTRWPVNWENEDSSKDYDVKVTFANGSSSGFKAYHNSSRRGICSEPCVVEVVGVGSIKADYGETVKVKNGSLYKTK